MSRATRIGPWEVLLLMIALGVLALSVGRDADLSQPVSQAQMRDGGR